MKPRIYRYALLDARERWLVVTLFGISLYGLAYCLYSCSVNEVRAAVFFGTISAGSIVGPFVWLLWRTRRHLRVGERSITLHRFLRRPVRIDLSACIFAEKHADEKTRGILLAEEEGASGTRKAITIPSSLVGYDDFSRFLRERVPERSDGEAQRCIILGRLEDGLVVGAGLHVSLLFALGSLFIPLAVLGVMAPGEINSWQDAALDLFVLTLGIGSLVAMYFAHGSLLFGRYGVTLRTFFRRKHIPWRDVRACGWIRNHKRFVIRSDIFEFNATEAVGRHRALGDLMTAHFPMAEERRRLELPFALRTVWWFHALGVVPAALFFVVMRPAFVKAFTPPLAWSGDMAVALTMLLCLAAIYVPALCSRVRRIEFTAEAITATKLFGQKRYDVARLLDINQKDSEKIADMSNRALRLIFEDGSIPIFGWNYGVSQAFLHDELCRLYFGEADQGETAEEQTASDERPLFPFQSPSPLPHGARVHWLGLGQLALHLLLPVAVAGLVWLVRSQNAAL